MERVRIVGRVLKGSAAMRNTVLSVAEPLQAFSDFGKGILKEREKCIDGITGTG